MKKIGIITMSVLLTAFITVGCQRTVQEKSIQTTMVPTADVLAGTQVESGIYQADYIQLGEEDALMNVTFDQDDRLVVTTEDVDGKQKAFSYDVKTKEKKKEAANQSASELGEPLSPKFLENAYMGEFAIANVGDICVSYNRVMNSNTDDYARIYRDKKIVYRGNRWREVMD